MKILITVGTTSFDELIMECDRIFEYNEGVEIIAQIGNSKYRPSHFLSFSFSHSIKNEYLKADLIICHAGAGTVYSLLELNKRIIVVPNLFRKDKHQIELCEYLEVQGYAEVVRDLSGLKKCIDLIWEKKFKPYRNNTTLLTAEIEKLITDEINSC